jgi:hypothetical protein
MNSMDWSTDEVRVLMIPSPKTLPLNIAALGTKPSTHEPLGHLRSKPSARSQWLTPVILATQKAEIRRMAVRSQPWANSLGDPISKKPFTKKGWWSGSKCRSEFKSQYCKKKKIQTLTSTKNNSTRMSSMPSILEGCWINRTKNRQKKWTLSKN